MDQKAMSASGICVHRRPLISNRVFGALLFVFVDLMFFSALISSFLVVRGGRQSWDLPRAIHLPILETGFNTAVLIMSGISLFLAGNVYGRYRNGKVARQYLLRAIVLGSFFAGFQIYLGFRLFGAGLTMTSTLFGGWFFFLVGAHTLHTSVGIALMTGFYRAMGKSVEPSSLRALQVFWLFVVGIWPALYAAIYF